MRTEASLLRGCAIALLCAGCASLNGTQVSTPKEAPPPAAAPSCPESIAVEEPLEADYGDALHPRTFLADLEPKTLRYQPASIGMHVHEKFREMVKLAGGTVVLLGSEFDRGVGLVLMAPKDSGHCVINNWSTWYSSNADLTLDSTWVSPDKKLAILLLKMVVGPGTAEQQTRWVVLGTDGKRAWVALGKPPQHQLLVPSVRLRPSGRQLFLEATLKRVSRYPLGRDGHFVIPN